MAIVRAAQYVLFSAVTVGALVNMISSLTSANYAGALASVAVIILFVNLVFGRD